MTLANASRGDRLRIVSIPNESVRAQFIRFGIGEGSEVALLEKLPSGPVILGKGRQEIALGRKLSESIEVVKVH